jgi:hypothetical protein
MKYIKALVSTVICAFVLTLTSTASAQDAKQGVVTVVRIQGEARYSNGDNVWHPLKLGATLTANDVVQSGANSTVDLVLADKAAHVSFQSGAGAGPGGSVNIAGLPIKPISGAGQSAPEQNIIRLQADTVLAIDKFTFSQAGPDTVSDTELNLRQGKIFGNVKKVSAASQYIIKMPTGVAGVRGTSFFLGSDGSVTTIFGSVVVSFVGSNGQPVTGVVSAGESFDPQTGNVTNLRTGTVTSLQTGQSVGQLTRREIRQDIGQLVSDVTAIVASIGPVTVVETTTANGSDTTTVLISPTSGSITIKL